MGMTQKLVSAVCNQLQTFRDESGGWDGIWAASMAVCEVNNIPVENEVMPRDGIRPRRRRKLPTALSEFVVGAPIEQQTDFLATSHE